MVLRTLFTLISCFSLLFSYAQNGNAVLEVGGKKMNLYALSEEPGVKSKYSFSFVSDTMATLKMSKNMWKIDTLVEMDLVTQEEKMAFATDSMLRVHSNLGQQTKQDISAAITDGFSLSKNCECTVTSIDLVIIKESGSAMHIDYAKPEQITKVKQQVEALSKGATVILKNINLKCPDNQNGFDELTFADMAVMKIKE